MIAQHLTKNFDIIFLFYGFFFIVMGLSIALQVKKRSMFYFAKICWLLACFALIHGFNEWFDMIALWRLSGNTIFTAIRISFLFVSYVFLLEFGRRLLKEHYDSFLIGRYLTPFLMCLSLFCMYYFDFNITIWPRYFIGFPGGLLTGLGFGLYYTVEKKAFDELNLRKYFFSLSLSFIFYSVLGGLITPYAEFFPASILNQDSFLKFFHVPVQLFRALFAGIAAWSIWNILGIFNWEFSYKLMTEIKKRKEIEKDLQLFRDLLDQSNDAVFVIDPKTGKFMDFNNKAIKSLQYSKAELFKLGVPDIENKIANLSEWRDHVEHLKEVREMIFDGEHVRKDGNTIPVEISIKYIELDNRNYLLAVARDTSERLSAQLKQKKDKEFIEIVINALEYPFYVIATDYKIVLANKAAKEKGIFEHGFCYKMTHHVTEPCKDEHGCPLREVIKNKRSVVIEHIHTDQFGEKQIVEVHGDPIFNSKGEVVQMIEYAIDITDRKKAEQALARAYEQIKQTQEELIQSGKMAAMGQLAAGISHELNQPLTGIKMIVQNLLKHVNFDEMTSEDLEEIISQSDRMDNIISNVRFFARKAAFVFKEVSIDKPIKDALKLLSGQLKLYNIELNLSIKEGLPKISGDENQLQQVFINLITNSRDAIVSNKAVKNGKIEIETKFDNSKKEIIVILRDNGCGMPKEVQEDIFNPFFTTKSPNKGMGLGLSIVYRIIENHKGHIELESQIGKGTSFTIKLPVVKDE